MRVGKAVALLVSAPIFLLADVLVQITGRRATRSTLSHFAETVLQAVDVAAKRNDELRILVPTGTSALLAELLVLPSLTQGPLPRIAFLFHEEPEVYADWYRPIDLNILAVRLQGSGWGDCLRVFATNPALAKRLTQLLRVSVDSIGDVFSADQVKQFEDIARGNSSKPLSAAEKKLLDNLRDIQKAGLKLAYCPGPMRPDKGARHIQTMLDALGTNAQFHLVFQIAPPQLAEVHNTMLRIGSPRSTVLRPSLSDEAYTVLLGMADIVLLPYEQASYRSRISRVFAEATLAERPIVASAGMASEGMDYGGKARFITDWKRWPEAARELLANADAGGPANRRNPDFEGLFRRWMTVSGWLVAPMATVMPTRPVLFIRTAWLASGSATVFQQQLRHFAERKVPVLELIVSRDCRPNERCGSWSEVLQDRSRSAAQVTLWTSPRSGLFGVCSAWYVALRYSRGRTFAAQQAELTRLCPWPGVIRRALRRRGLSFILVNHYFNQPIIASLEKQVPVWIETHDVHSRHITFQNARNALTGRIEAFDELIEDELSYLRGAKVIGAINVDELVELRTRLGAHGDRVLLCQPAVELVATGATVEPFDVLIVASNNPPNVIGMRWFVESVLPLLEGRKPTIRVVGNIDEAAGRLTPTDLITYVGPVRDLEPYYRAARVVALPVVCGTGLSIKGVEALAAGRPIVATPLAFRGLPAHFQAPPVHSEAAPFAKRMLQLLNDPQAHAEAIRATQQSYRSLELQRRFRCHPGVSAASARS